MTLKYVLLYKGFFAGLKFYEPIKSKNSHINYLFLIILIFLNFVKFAIFITHEIYPCMVD